MQTDTRIRMCLALVLSRALPPSALARIARRHGVDLRILRGRVSPAGAVVNVELAGEPEAVDGTLRRARRRGVVREAPLAARPA